MSNLKETRLKYGLRPCFIAAQLGITYNQWYNLESGLCKLDKLKIEKLMQIFRLQEKEIIEIANITYKGGN